MEHRLAEVGSCLVQPPTEALALWQGTCREQNKGSLGPCPQGTHHLIHIEEVYIELQHTTKSPHEMRA